MAAEYVLPPSSEPPDDFMPEIRTTYELGPFPCRVWDHPSDETKSLGYVLTDEVMRSSDYSNFRARADHALRYRGKETIFAIRSDLRDGLPVR